MTNADQRAEGAGQADVSFADVPRALPVPGWYPDPAGNGRDRWWTGTEWSDLSARNPHGPLDMGMAGYTRAMRSAMNRDARIAKWTAMSGFLLWVLSIVVAGVLASAGVIAPSVGGGLLTCLAVGFVLDVASVVFGVRGISRAPRLGGLGAAIYGVTVGAVFGLVSVMTIVVAIV